MRISATITLQRHVGALTVSDCEREWDVDGVDVEERVQVVGDVQDRGEGEPAITIESVDGTDPKWLTKRERDDLSERLWFAFLDQTEAR